MNKTEALE